MVVEITLNKNFEKVGTFSDLNRARKTAIRLTKIYNDVISVRFSTESGDFNNNNYIITRYVEFFVKGKCHHKVYYVGRDINDHYILDIEC